jgi:hypothetical protein
MTRWDSVPRGRPLGQQRSHTAQADHKALAKEVNDAVSDVMPYSVLRRMEYASYRGRGALRCGIKTVLYSQCLKEDQ